MMSGDCVRVDTWPAAVWRILTPKPGDAVGTFRLLRLDRANGSRVELAGVTEDRLTVDRVAG